VLDVIVVGGGPGGLYASWRLAQKGLSVTVAEEHGTAGHPVHCTGVLAPEAFREFALPDEAILNELRTACFYSPSGQKIEYATDGVEAVVVDRDWFDQRLCELAQDAGVEVRLGSKVTNIATAKTHVEVRRFNETHPLRARACILATGASYGLQRQMGLGLPPVHLNSAQAELPAAPLEEVELHFGAEIAPQGFAWVVPVRRRSESHARVGLMCEGNAALYFERFLERGRTRWQLRTNGRITPRQRMLPLAPIRKTYADRLLVVGDAAGLVKSTTGGGIYYSLVSAAIAADVLAEALGADQLSETTLRAYERRWRQRLDPELQAQLTLRFLAQRLTDPEIEELFDLARTDGLMPLIRKTARFNHHYEVIAALLRYPATRKILFRRLSS
jgi:digeranylgeranylglycerophospholipid reductase